MLGWVVMNDREHVHEDVIDKDLYEDLDEEEWYEIVIEAQREAQIRAQQERKRKEKEPKRPFPKWAFWLIAIAMFFNVFAFFPQTFSIPIIDFLKTSAKLSLNDDIATYKKSVVVIETEGGRGTGFSIAEDGTILTNYHVIEGYNNITVAYKDEGLFRAEVLNTFPEIDLAVITVDEENLPYLQLAGETTFTEEESVYFIGNPLRFRGIANEGTIIDYIRLRDWEDDVIMIEAPIYRGNSGSPIINDAGEVIGVVFATLQSKEHGKVGLFVPIDHYYSYSENLEEER